MENNIQTKNEEENQDLNQNEEQDNNNLEEENGEEEIGEEEQNMNYNGEYEAEMEGEEEVQEENMEEAQNEIEGEEMEINKEKEEEINDQQGEEDYEQINNQKEEIQKENENDNLNENGEEEENNNNKINNKEQVDINININNNNNIKKKENVIENLNNTNNKDYNNLINKYKNSNTNDINNKLNNLQRIELINDKLNMNINRIQQQQKIKPKKENIIENEIEKEQEFNNNKIINSRKNDILSEILFKIQDFKQRKDNFDNIRDNYNSNKILNDLDKEITRGLERLNNRRLMQDTKNIEISSTNQVEKKILKNPKFKEIVTMINDKEGKKFKKAIGLGKNDLLNMVNNKKRNDIFGNINLFSQKKSNNISNTFQKNIIKKPGLDSNKFYVSCIDGKAIVNGMRKDIPIVSKFNNLDRLNNHNLLEDYSKINLTVNNFNRNKYRNNNFNFKNEFTFNERRTGKKFNIDLGKDDLNINNTLKLNFNNEKWNKDNNYFKGGLKYFK